MHTHRYTTAFHRFWLCTLLCVAFSHGAAAQTFFVVRHAERADSGSAGTTMMATDPELSDAGRTRAEKLAVLLKDAGVTAIFVTEYKRTQQTAAPLAKRLGLTVQVVPAKDVDGLMAKLKTIPGNALVIGHSNTVPETLKRLGVDTTVKIGDSDYDDLFIVSSGQKPSVVRLHYGS